MTLSIRDKLALALASAALVALAGAAWLLLATPQVSGGSITGAQSSGAWSSAPAASVQASASVAATLVVDVQGGVAHPGVVVLPPGARVADAIEAAGGFSAAADTFVAATALNLAAPVIDGAQVYVPLIGVSASPPAGEGTAGGGAGGSTLVNLNTATPEELEALPGIGPVTVQKIVAARAERPFTTLEELVGREVMNRGQLEEIRDLVTL